MKSSTDVSGTPRTELGQRLAESRRRQQAAVSSSRPRRSGSWDPAAAAGLSPGLMMAAIAIGGVGLALLAIGGVSAAMRSDGGEAAAETEALFVQPEVELAAPMAPDPAGAIEDYYILLRQGMVDIAWSRTTTGFQETNYPAGYPAYAQTWAGTSEVDVLTSSVVWQTASEANVVAELHDTSTDRLFKNSYSLRFDPDTGLWSIASITTLW
jgi:hypothetical protein